MEENYELRRAIDDYLKEVCHYSQMQVFSTSSYQRNYFQQQIDTRVDGMVKFLQLYYQDKTHAPISGIHGAETAPFTGSEEAASDNLYSSDGNRDPQSYALLQEQGQMEPGPPESGSPPGNSPEEAGPPENSEVGELREFTPEELSEYDGMDGRPAYVAVDGIVYDVSHIMRWAGGRHFGLVAGQDHTHDFMLCHNGMQARLDSLPIVGILI